MIRTTNSQQKLYHLWASLDIDATINEVTPFENVVFLTQSSIIMLLNDPQTADKLPTKIISFVGEAGHRRNHK